MFRGLAAIIFGLFGVAAATSKDNGGGGFTSALKKFGPFQIFGPFQPKDKTLAAARPILAMIAQHESNNNYNVIYGGRSENLTGKTIGEVLAFQKQWLKNGTASTAVGAYQFLYGTLLELVNKLNIGTSERFGVAMQDKLALELLKRRGLQSYLDGRLSRANFMLSISREWASLPVPYDTQGHHRRVRAGETYYAGDGLNKALISPARVAAALNNARAIYA